ncbi:MAG: pro-sigmaK processing inhibitor BofA family protein [Clostridia bacterium]|nr:pro-sigmaK processing inhibitor BofA family protein [Clostridia bacterium]
MGRYRCCGDNSYRRFGCTLGLNALSGIACAALGVPGVITLLLLKLIFGI